MINKKEFVSLAIRYYLSKGKDKQIHSRIMNEGTAYQKKKFVEYPSEKL